MNLLDLNCCTLHKINYGTPSLSMHWLGSHNKHRVDFIVSLICLV